MKPETQSSIAGLFDELLESIAREDGKVVIEAKNGLVTLTHEFEDEPSREAIAPSYEVNQTIRRLIDALLGNTTYVVELVSDKETYHNTFDSISEAREYAEDMVNEEHGFSIVKIWECTLNKRGVLATAKGKVGSK